MEEKNYKDIKNDRLEILLEECNDVKIGDKAPLFCAQSSVGEIKLTDYIGKWVLLFSYPRKLHTDLYD